jgi:hypothetical protein
MYHHSRHRSERLLMLSSPADRTTLASTHGRRGHAKNRGSAITVLSRPAADALSAAQAQPVLARTRKQIGLARRKRAYRQRSAAGRVVLPLELNEPELAEALLIRSERLREMHPDEQVGFITLKQSEDGSNLEAD